MNIHAINLTMISGALALFSLAFALASQAGAQDAKPWQERVMTKHLERRDYTGELDSDALEALKDRGETLFDSAFTAADGAGRPMATQAIIPTKRRWRAPRRFERTSGLDATACTGCHNKPGPGGAGDFAANVFVSEGFGNPDFDTTDPQFSNERNTNHLFGAGLTELLAREMTADLHAIREETLAKARTSGFPQTVPLMSKGVSFGKLSAEPDGFVDLYEVEGVDSDLVVRPFGQKGVFVSLRQFTVNALNQHHGMQARERFGARWTGESDFDEDGKADEIHEGDISALTAWQATLPPPGALTPESAKWREKAAAGREIFDHLGCASCHRPSLPLRSLTFSDPGPLDVAGTLRKAEGGESASYDLGQNDWARDLPRNEAGEVLVPLFGDLKRHKMADGEVNAFGNELLSQRFVERDVFITAELWGVASSGPYGHRGDMLTMEEAIGAHGGEGRASREAFLAAEPLDRENLIAYLKTLRISP